MIHTMKLHNEPFELIKNGSKTIELRLYDEKRQLISIGDIIKFENRITFEQIKVRVINIHKYSSFEELYKNFNKISLGYNENEIANPNDMELYYSKEEQQKYGVIGIEIELINSNKKEIIHNSDNLSVSDINNVVRRAKLLVANKNKILICKCNNNYFFIGGHIEENESDMEGLHREILEESGVDINLGDLDLFMSIKYLNKNYPELEKNTFSMTNYYLMDYDLVPNENNMKLEKAEKAGGFTLDWYDKSEVIFKLENSLETATRKNVTLDTIEVLKEYLKISK